MGMDISKIQMGAAKIFVDEGGVWSDVGATMEGATFETSVNYFDLIIDQFGDTPVSKIQTGELASISFTIAQNELTLLQLAMPMGTLYSSGGKLALGGGRSPGTNALTLAKKIKLHPINQLGSDGADDLTYLDHDIILWKALSTEGIALPYRSGEVQKYAVKMVAFPDTSQTSGRQLYLIGDPSATADTTPPDILSSVPADAAAGVVVTASPVLITSKPIRTSDETLLGVVKLQVASTHADVACVITAEQYIEGTALAGTATTMDLATGDVPADDALNGLYVEITGGAGKSSTLIAITDSAAANNRITVAAWPAGTPDTTSTYKVHGSRITINPDASLTALTAHDILTAGLIDMSANAQGSVDKRSFTTA